MGILALSWLIVKVIIALALVVSAIVAAFVAWGFARAGASSAWNAFDRFVRTLGA